AWTGPLEKTPWRLGQIAVIAAAAALLWLLRPVVNRPRDRLAAPASCAIALVGAYWTIERLGLLR
ncbi:MAG: hypothetical protein H0U19_13405, partial [Acidobacteria bacterium]|nr:hypothetical protein [Acidobacteriota bacterium]